MRFWFINKISFVILLAFFSTSAFSLAKKTQWQPLLPGISYTLLSSNENNTLASIHVFKIALQQYRLELAFASEQQSSSAFVSQMAEFHRALIAINGGFFSPALKPLGLRIKNGTTINPIKNTSWWGILTIDKNNVAKIQSRYAFVPVNNIVFALQAGPRLVTDGSIPKLKAGLSERSAVGINKNGELILLVTQNLPISTQALAEMMRQSESQGGLGCINALNLDGGSSSQLYAEIGEFRLNVQSLRGVADAILVLPH